MVGDCYVFKRFWKLINTQKDIKEKNGKTKFKAEITSGEFYEFVRALEQADVRINSFTECDNDLEGIFMDLVSSKNKENSIERFKKLNNTLFKS